MTVEYPPIAIAACEVILVPFGDFLHSGPRARWNVFDAETGEIFERPSDWDAARTTNRPLRYRHVATAKVYEVAAFGDEVALAPQRRAGIVMREAAA